MNSSKLNYIFLALVVGLFVSCVGSNSDSSNSSKDITAFSILGVSGTISGTAVSLTLPIGTSFATLTPTITVSQGASVSPASGVARDFTNAVTYTVTASDATTNEYVVTVIRAPGAKSIFNVDGVIFKMAYIPGGLTFPQGIFDETEATVDEGYWIGETEVTYELWSTVHAWATDPARGADRYSFSNDGNEGSNGALDPLMSDQQPVTEINWRNSMVFSNALTEWYNTKTGTNYTLVYYTDAAYTLPIRAATDSDSVCAVPGCEDDPYIKSDATGFRLPTDNEWELAARYKDGTNWTPGNYASGATDYAADPSTFIANPNEEPTKEVAWCDSNSDGHTHAVKGKLPNSLGLYDMSGNVLEWNFDWQDANAVPLPTRLVNGGANGPPYGLMIGEYFFSTLSPDDHDTVIGFRLSRTDL